MRIVSGHQGCWKSAQRVRNSTTRALLIGCLRPPSCHCQTLHNLPATNTPFLVDVSELSTSPFPFQDESCHMYGDVGIAIFYGKVLLEAPQIGLKFPATPASSNTLRSDAATTARYQYFDACPCPKPIATHDATRL